MLMPRKQDPQKTYLSKKLSNEECLELHKKIVHTMAQKIFSCEMCNIDFSARKYLFIHKNHSHKYDENLVNGEIKAERAENN